MANDAPQNYACESLMLIALQNSPWKTLNE
jgi:hypothetical protein